MEASRVVRNRSAVLPKYQIDACIEDRCDHLYVTLFIHLLTTAVTLFGLLSKIMLCCGSMVTFPHYLDAGHILSDGLSLSWVARVSHSPALWQIGLAFSASISLYLVHEPLSNCIRIAISP